MKYINKTSGFTLIEVMIVIAILAIVSAVAIPAYTGYMTTARMTEAKNNIAALRLAEEEYFLENNDYFYKEGTNAQLSTASGGLWTATGSEGVVNFTYTISDSGGNSYSILATGKTGTKVAGKTETYP